VHEIALAKGRVLKVQESVSPVALARVVAVLEGRAACASSTRTDGSRRSTPRTIPALKGWTQSAGRFPQAATQPACMRD
jgi:hypothetical protein